MSDLDLKKLLEAGRSHDRAVWADHVERASQPPRLRVMRSERDEDGSFIVPDDPDEAQLVYNARKEARDARKAKSDAESKALEAYEAMSPLERADVPAARREVFDGMIAKRSEVKL